MGLIFNNAGTVDVSSGTLQLGGSFPGGEPVTNAGAVTIGSGSTLVALSEYDQIAGSTTLDGGTFSSSNLNIQGGDLSGFGAINANVSNGGQVVSWRELSAAGVLSINVKLHAEYVRAAGSIPKSAARLPACSTISSSSAGRRRWGER